MGKINVFLVTGDGSLGVVSFDYGLRHYSKVLERLISKDDLMYSLALYVMADKKFVSLGKSATNSILNEPLPEISLEPYKTIYLSMIVTSLTELRDESKGNIVLSDETNETLKGLGVIK